MIRFFFLIPLLLLSACGYHFGQGNITKCYCSVYIPYVEGDSTGEFTATLIRTLGEQGRLRYQNYCADLLLEVCLLEPDDRNIGFTYAPDSKILVSNEARLSLTAKVTLIDQQKGCTVLGPIEVTTWLDYDFQPDLSILSANNFSLGQLEMHNLAMDSAFSPVYSLLAEKIVDYVNNSW